jgi:hypothetical protein
MLKSEGFRAVANIPTAVWVAGFGNSRTGGTGRCAALPRGSVLDKPGPQGSHLP